MAKHTTFARRTERRVWRQKENRKKHGKRPWRRSACGGNGDSHCAASSVDKSSKKQVTWVQGEVSLQPNCRLLRAKNRIKWEESAKKKKGKEKKIQRVSAKRRGQLSRT